MSELTFDVDKETFETAVIEASRDRVIMVAIWAPWCGPCRTLSPVLDEVVEAMDGGVAVAKVNVDENPELASAFRVQGIPAVKIFKDGQMVQEFAGALPREQIEELLRPFVTTVADDLMERATALAAAGDFAEADRVYQQILEEEPGEQEALLGLAFVRLRLGKFDAAGELAAMIALGDPGYDQAQAIHKHVELSEICEQAGGRDSCATAAAGSPDDLDSRYRAACCAAAAWDHATALAQWLGIVERDRNFAEGAAKEAMVSVFHLLGRENQMVADYQKKLYRALH